MSGPANQIEEATEMVRSIPDFLEAVSGVLQTPYGWLVLAGLLAWFLINRDVGNLFAIFERGERARLEKLESYVNNPSAADGQALEVIKDLRDAYYFKIATGIYAEKGRRESLIKLHDETSHAINWKQIKWALPFISSKPGGSLVVRDLEFKEKVSKYYNLAVGFIFLVFSIALFLMLLIASPKSISDVLITLAAAFAPALFAIFVFSQNWPFQSAERIKEELKSLDKKNQPESPSTESNDRV